MDVEIAIRKAQEGDDGACLELDDRVASGELPWAVQRRTGIGGSDVAAALGFDRWRRPIDVWLEKTGRAEPWQDSEPARWGRILEPVIAADYAQRHGVELRGPLQTQRDAFIPWHLATVDRLICSDGKPTAVLEIKSRGWHRLADYGEAGTDDVPLGDLCQLTWYRHVLGIDNGVISALFNTSQVRDFVVPRDHDLERDLVEAMDRWWREYVIRDVAPPADGSDSYGRYLTSRYEDGRGLAIPTAHELDLIGRLRAAEAIRRRAEDACTLLRQRVGAELGACSGYDLAAVGDGKLGYKLERGRPQYSAVARELAQRLGLSDSELSRVVDSHRGKAPRVMRLPRSWRDDNLDDVYSEVYSDVGAELSGLVGNP